MTFTFKLEQPDGTPADPPNVRLGVYSWKPGDMITLGRRSLRVVDVRDQGDDEPTVLVSRTWPNERLAVRARGT